MDTIDCESGWSALHCSIYYGEIGTAISLAKVWFVATDIAAHSVPANIATMFHPFMCVRVYTTARCRAGSEG